MAPITVLTGRLPARALLGTAALAALLSVTACRDTSAPPVTRSTTALPKDGLEGALALPPPALGAKAPLVVVTLFTDFQCPYCREMAPAMHRVVETWPDAVQVQFRHLPLSFHPLAEAAARASVAAQLQGRFQAVHDLLFHRQAEWSELPDVAAFEGWVVSEATRVGLDAARFTADLRAPATAARVAADDAKAQGLGLPGTPAVFVGGRLAEASGGVSGILTLVRQAVARGQRDLAQGVPRAEIPRRSAATEATDPRLAGWLIDDRPADGPDGADGPDEGERPQPLPRSGDAGRAVPQERWEVPVRADDPARGPARAPVTLVLFEDIQCPFCADLFPTLERLLERYPDTARLVVKSLPLPFHAQARPAALALECARQRGQFWPLRQRLVEQRDALSPELIDAQAAAVGLDADAFAACLQAPATAQRVDQDIALAERVGARGTPVLYVNGRKVAGSRPLPELVALVDAELEHARAVARDTLDPYPAILAGAAALDPLSPDTAALDLADAPRRGPTDAPVRLVLWNDLACEPCRQVGRAVAGLATAAPAPGEPAVAVHVRPFVPAGDAAAELAARGLLCGGRLAVFWALHDLLSRRGPGSRQDLIDAAGAVGAAPDAMAACLDDETTSAAVARAAAEARRLGVDRAPTLFVDGHRYDGSLGFGPRSLRRLIRTAP